MDHARIVFDNHRELSPLLETEPIRITCETLHQRWLKPLRLSLEEPRPHKGAEQLYISLLEFVVECGVARHPFWPSLCETATRARLMIEDPSIYPLPEKET